MAKSDKFIEQQFRDNETWDSLSPLQQSMVQFSDRMYARMCDKGSKELDIVIEENNRSEQSLINHGKICKNLAEMALQSISDNPYDATSYEDVANICFIEDAVIVSNQTEDLGELATDNG